MDYYLRPNKQLTNDNHIVVSVQIIKLGFTTIEDVLLFLQNCRQKLLAENNTKWLVHPLRTEHQQDKHLKTFYYFEPIKKLNQLFAEQGTLLQQIEYLTLMGVTDAIDRRPDLREAVIYHQFYLHLSQLGIKNPPLTIDSTGRFTQPIKRIHAVHPSFFEDEEVCAGLHITTGKNRVDDKVLYVCSPQTLELAIRYCTKDSMLIIDGHWENNKKSMHGVWDIVDAEYIGNEIALLLNKYPEKINDIKLWGCQAGYLAAFNELSKSFNPERLVFKDESLSSFYEKEMAEFRNRAVYHSENGEFPYAIESLAGQIATKLNDQRVNITATSANGYPFPVGLKARFNIASDSDEWKGLHLWKKTADDVLPTWYSKLHRLKSLTVIGRTNNAQVAYADSWRNRLSFCDLPVSSSAAESVVSNDRKLS